MPSEPPSEPPTDPADQAASPLGPLQRVRLTRSLWLWQRARGHRSATDDVLCAWAGLLAAPGARRVLDLGAGQGSVTLMLAGALPRARLVAVEAQAVSFQLLRRNVVGNGLEGRVVPVLGDLRQVDLTRHALPPQGDAEGRVGGDAEGPVGFDLVTGSPPFIPPGAGTLPADAQRAAARFELRGGVEAYAQAAARWLRPGGRAVLLMDGAQDARSRAALRGAGLVLRRRIIVTPAPGKPPRYRIYVGERPAAPAAGPGAPFEDLALTVRDARGAWTQAFADVRRALELPGS